MSLSPLQDLPLCVVYRLTPEGDEESVCQASQGRTTALVLSLIGVLFISVGLYLLLGNIGTIPSFSIGCSLLLGGLGFSLGGATLLFKSLYVNKKNN